MKEDVDRVFDRVFAELAEARKENKKVSEDLTQAHHTAGSIGCRSRHSSRVAS